jgi:hypothetical protein
MSTPRNWIADLSPREQAQVVHATAYARNFDDAGVPGHGQFILIAKLAAKLDTLEAREGPHTTAPEPQRLPPVVPPRQG